MRIAIEIVLTAGEQEELMTLVRSGLTSVQLALRARIILLSAQGMQNKDIAVALGVDRGGQVSRWRERYSKQRLAGIERDLPRCCTIQGRRGPAGRADHREQARSCYTLEYAYDGGATGCQRGHGIATLASKRLEATSGSRVQGFA